MKLIPFLLDGVGGIPTLNQADGIHPTIEGHQILAKNVLEVLEGVIKKEFIELGVLMETLAEGKNIVIPLC